MSKIVVTGTRGIPGIMGGVETHCEELYPRLAALGWDVTVICRSSYIKEKTPFYKGVKLYFLEIGKSKYMEAFLHTFLAIFIARFRLKADVLHIHAIGPALMTPLARLLGLKVVFTHHGPDYDRLKWGLFARCVLRLGEFAGVVFANEVIVISEVIRESVCRRFGRKDVHLIYNGVPGPERVENTAYLDTLGLEKDRYLFSMGRFVPEKRFEMLIRAFRPLREQGYRLVIAGDNYRQDAYTTFLKDLASAEGVIMPGFLKGAPLHCLLTHAHSFALPSAHEGLPIALLEAMTYGLNVVVSDIPAHQAIGLPEDFYFPVSQEGILGEKLEHLFEKAKQPVGYAMNNYNWDRIAEEVGSLYGRL